MKGIGIFIKGIDRILNFSGIIAGIAILLISFFVTWGVLARLLHIDASWVVPITVYMFVASSYLAASYAMKNLEHIRVDILIQQLPIIVRKILDTLLMIVSLLFFTYVTLRSFDMFHNSFVRKTTDLSLLQIQVWIPQLFVVIGFIFLCLSIIRHILMTWTMDGYGMSGVHEEN
ncbi:TRAP transporter small permease [Ureibacillus acetophenoni]|uniref:TRAP-type mannitol/chloroaromatic compound transport system permease small subunit n=1 Tax=Ureibacillus acetophenoni TaxID=614649 RepID=A0A285U7M7_9BACL|nr:TRAP transporter small permease [Ureibacillus acetophenoni]SOC37842.1 TRAP-type mannitol/chloroaromatic compound transport system permease small subunit [Ureibacillus acetophenoni]